MARIILHMNGLFFEWSTISEGPVTRAMDRESFIADYLRRNSGPEALQLDSRMRRAVETGTSSMMGDTIEGLTHIAGLNGQTEWDTPEKLLAYVTRPLA